VSFMRLRESSSVTVSYKGYLTSPIDWLIPLFTDVEDEKGPEWLMSW
jgi:hypothetical protein